MIQDEFLINERLKDFLNRLSHALEVPFVESEVDRMFADFDNDQRPQKLYTFYSSKKLTVFGIVGEYEPETLQIQINGTLSHEKVFLNLIDDFFPFDWTRPIR